MHRHKRLLWMERLLVEEMLEGYLNWGRHRIGNTSKCKQYTGTNKMLLTESYIVPKFRSTSESLTPILPKIIHLPPTGSLDEPRR